MDSRPDTCRKWQWTLTILGVMVTYLPVGVDWFWGNVSVYASSFIWCTVSSDFGAKAAWVLSLYDAFWALSVMAIGPLARYVEGRHLLLGAMIFVDLSLFLSSLTVQTSWPALIITIGACTGIGQGCIFGVCLQILIEVASENLGLLLSIYLSSVSIGGVLMSFVCTWYVNPQNKSPDLSLGSTVLFTQKDVIDKVPSMFMLLGAVAVSLHITGLLLLQVYPSMRFFNFRPNSKNCTSERTSILQKERKAVADNFAASPDIPDGVISSTSPKDTANDDNDNKSKDVTPGAMLMMTSFYALWTSVLVSEIPYIVLFSYYKSYGQTWIHDDHFFAYLGTTFVVIPFSRLLMGVAIDKLGPKSCLLFMQGSIVVLSSWYYFTAALNRWAYFLATLSYGAITCIVYSTYIATSALLYGKRHVTTNFGFLISATLVADFGIPILMDLVLEKFGWFVVFAGSGGLNLIALCLCSIFIPRGTFRN